MTTAVPPAPSVIAPATTGAFGLLPAADFRLATGECRDCTTIPQALWFFRHERIAVPQPGRPLAGFARTQPLAADLAAWHAATPLGSALDYPPLVWTAADGVIPECRLTADGQRLAADGVDLPLALAPRHPLNRSWLDASSMAFLAQRPLRVRGDWQGGRFVARTLWPLDFRLPNAPPARPLAADPQALRARLREQAQGGARSPFAVEQLWRRPGTDPDDAGRPVLAFILNGAQGDDDEAHGGHFAVLTGRVGDDGAIHDWLAANYYTLDAESEKGIVAAPVPLDNYLADVNAGQAWYRPSYLLVAVLREARVAAHVQSALGRVYNQFYRHQFSYQHARANCAGISVSALRALGWRIPARGPESWLRAIAALPAVALANGSLRQGKASFDYLTEDRSRLYPAVAFEEIGADLLRLAGGTAGRPLSTFEETLAGDLDALLLVRIPQLPSSRAWGDHPVVDSREYHRRVPKDPAQRQIVPVGPRPFPKDFVDPQAPREPPLRSDYALAGYGLLLLLIVALALRALL
ncbi:hypothetical protein [Azospira restricta]|uniref:Uncharacterized protein n=1 Tax=Azospira restricta TaxID=404405 RepID=A0A974SLZ0_9RHOO|nr:hypothetical protein [Azospira restricta]QRJ62185.1 hypothetical protein IWH25_10265 [Azospira restricta]